MELKLEQCIVYTIVIFGGLQILHSISLALFLCAVWLLLSGHFDPLLLGLGGFSIALTTLVAHRMDVVDHEGQPLQVTGKTIPYMLWLSKEVVKSNWQVLKTICSPKLPISPTLALIPATPKSDLVKSMYANSITLTPGTVSMKIEDNLILVHALSAQGIVELQAGDMAKRLEVVEPDTINWSQLGTQLPFVMSDDAISNNNIFNEKNWPIQRQESMQNDKALSNVAAESVAESVTNSTTNTVSSGNAASSGKKTHPPDNKK